jgi:hypothetical protein
MYERLNLGDHKNVAICLKSVSSAYHNANDPESHLRYALRSLEMYNRLDLDDHRDVVGHSFIRFFLLQELSLITYLFLLVHEPITNVVAVKRPGPCINLHHVFFSLLV